jgi:hypothetical protein
MLLLVFLSFAMVFRFTRICFIATAAADTAIIIHQHLLAGRFL